eukprot:TRINITY_DN992_c0_g1_i1.p1 TRINITY_DN992_c0_g1~~TRINITY_DN992_c0_g1_i1.p1  ORF type:complete len:810 (-),score=168.29 TRINITY_DN992_c0_g1_i1:514-2850(-)
MEHWTSTDLGIFLCQKLAGVRPATLDQLRQALDDQEVDGECVAGHIAAGDLEDFLKKELSMISAGCRDKAARVLRDRCVAWESGGVQPSHRLPSNYSLQSIGDSNGFNPSTSHSGFDSAHSHDTHSLASSGGLMSPPPGSSPALPPMPFDHRTASLFPASNAQRWLLGCPLTVDTAATSSFAVREPFAASSLDLMRHTFDELTLGLRDFIARVVHNSAASMTFFAEDPSREVASGELRTYENIIQHPGSRDSKALLEHLLKYTSKYAQLCSADPVEFDKLLRAVSARTRSEYRRTERFDLKSEQGFIQSFANVQRLLQFVVQVDEVFRSADALCALRNVSRLRKVFIETLVRRKQASRLFHARMPPAQRVAAAVEALRFLQDRVQDAAVTEFVLEAVASRLRLHAIPVSTAEELRSAVESARVGAVLSIRSGQYTLAEPLQVRQSGVVLQAAGPDVNINGAVEISCAMATMVGLHLERVVVDRGLLEMEACTCSTPIEYNRVNGAQVVCGNMQTPEMRVISRSFVQPSTQRHMMPSAGPLAIGASHFGAPLQVQQQLGSLQQQQQQQVESSGAGVHLLQSSLWAALSMNEDKEDDELPADFDSDSDPLEDLPHGPSALMSDLDEGIAVPRSQSMDQFSDATGGSLGSGEPWNAISQSPSRSMRRPPPVPSGVPPFGSSGSQRLSTGSIGSRTHPLQPVPVPGASRVSGTITRVTDTDGFIITKRNSETVSVYFRMEWVRPGTHPHLRQIVSFQLAKNPHPKYSNSDVAVDVTAVPPVW